MGLVDTSVLVGLEQRRLDAQSLPASAALSVVTLEELWLGVLLAGPDLQRVRQSTFDLAVQSFDTLPVDAVVARTSGDIRAQGRRAGRRYGLADSLIGATARVRALPLWTQDAGMLGMAGVDVRVL